MRRCSRPLRITPRRDALGVRAEVGWLPCARHRRWRGGHPHEPQRERTGRALRPRGAGGEARPGTADAVLDGEIWALDARGTGSSASSGTARERSCSSSSTCSRSIPSRSSTSRSSSAAAGSRTSSTRSRRCCRLASLRGRTGALRRGQRGGLEGVVAKRKDSRCLSGRRRTGGEGEGAGAPGGRRRWLPRGRRRRYGFGALVVGAHEAGGRRWAGNVGTGFSDEELDRL